MQANNMSGPDLVVDVQPLQLKLLHSHGKSAVGVLTLPASGIGLAQALALGGERLNTAQREDAERCRIAWQEPEEGWRLSHGSRAVVCVLNGRRVAAQANLPLAVGDVLEVGWQRFEVRPAVQISTTATAVPVTAPTLRPEPSVSPTTSTPTELPEFDLRDLDLLAHPSQTFEDPFGVLGIAGAEQRLAVDPLAELLGKAPRYAATPDTPEHPTPGAPIGPLENLHHEFNRVVRDPTQLTGRADWDDLGTPGFERAPSLEELSRRAESYPLLRDILGKGERIDQTISGFHPLARPTLLDPDETEDVLRMFAPAQLRGAPVAVPSLTRREHHDLSPDSHMRFDVFQTDAEKEPPK